MCDAYLLSRRILDVGCGFGDSTVLWAKWLGNHFPTSRFQLTGLNISAYHVAEARRRVALPGSGPSLCTARGAHTCPLCYASFVLLE